jgi:porin
MVMRPNTLVSITFLTLALTGRVLAAAKDESAADWLPIPKEFNDWRNGLVDRGFSFGATYIGDNITNVTGGIKQGAIHFGRLDLGADADLEKFVGWTGAKVHANMFEIYGRGLTRNYVGNIATISEIEALPDTRAYMKPILSRASGASWPSRSASKLPT